VRRTS